MTKVLVLANETIGGEKLLDAILERSGEDVSFHVVVPRTRPRHGNVVYDEVVRDSAQVRVDLAREWMREHGIKSSGEVGDPDPFLAAVDAIAHEGHRRGHRLHAPGGDVGLAAARPARPPARGDRAAGRARDRRPRQGGPAVRRHAGGGERHRLL